MHPRYGLWIFIGYRVLLGKVIRPSNQTGKRSRAAILSFLFLSSRLPFVPSPNDCRHGVLCPGSEGKKIDWEAADRNEMNCIGWLTAREWSADDRWFIQVCIQVVQVLGERGVANRKGCETYSRVYHGECPRGKWIISFKWPGSSVGRATDGETGETWIEYSPTFGVFVQESRSTWIFPTYFNVNLTFFSKLNIALLKGFQVWLIAGYSPIGLGVYLS